MLKIVKQIVQQIPVPRVPTVRGNFTQVKAKVGSVVPAFTTTFTGRRK